MVDSRPVESADFLFELGTEELPPKALRQLGEALLDQIRAGLKQHELEFDAAACRWFAAPRRLAVLIGSLATRQSDTKQQRLGPAVAAAFDDQGNPTRAAEGFAGSCGVSVRDLERIETNKGERLGYLVQKPGQAASALLPEILSVALDRLPIPKRMRWGDGEHQFVRPVHWAVALHGSETVPGEIMGVAFGNQSMGHRFHHPLPVTVKTPGDYTRILHDARVMVDFKQRREAVASGVEAAARSASVSAILDPSLLDEVTALVEWPVALVGKFDEAFLELPAEVLIATMQGHQKFFPCRDESGALASAFIAVANLESSDSAQVVAGYERVIRPRLADARFFWQADLKVPLASYQPELAKMVYEKRLGTLWDKVERVASLLGSIGEALSLPVAEARQAAELCKCDLLSLMVGEFPELQGVMGRHYARRQGVDETVAAAIEAHYQPRFAGDRIPAGEAGRLLALADRLDTLAGIFAAGMKPSGTKDPYGLRRAALGVVRIALEGKLDLALKPAIERAVAIVREGDQSLDDVSVAVNDYIMERARGYFADNGISGDVFDAVAAVGGDGSLLDFHKRAQSLVAFQEREEAISLAAANKRIRNILRKADGVAPDQMRPDLLREKAEKGLYDWLSAVRRSLGRALEARDYEGALNHLASLREPVDQFFDQVMVMADDPDLRGNRLALLSSIRNCFLQVADIAHLNLESPAETGPGIQSDTEDG